MVWLEIRSLFFFSFCELFLFSFFTCHTSPKLHTWHTGVKLIPGEKIVITNIMWLIFSHGSFSTSYWEVTFKSCLYYSFLLGISHIAIFTINCSKFYDNSSPKFLSNIVIFLTFIVNFLRTFLLVYNSHIAIFTINCSKFYDNSSPKFLSNIVIFLTFIVNFPRTFLLVYNYIK